MTSEVDLKLSGLVSFSQTVEILQQRTGYKFAYGRAGDSECMIHLPEKAIPLQELLDLLFLPCGIQWTTIGKHIVLTPIPENKKGWKISGYIRDKASKTPLELASVFIPGTHWGTQTDSTGYFKITGIDRPKVTLTVRLLGYHSSQRRLRLPLHHKEHLQMELEPHIIPLKSAILRYDRIVDQTTISQITLQKKDLEGLLNISDDPLKEVSQLPAISGDGSFLGSDQLYIRGGEPEENLLLLDNVRFLWPYYIGGASVFNPEIIEKIEVMSGQFKAKYGQAMSGIINLTTRNGKLEHFKSTLGLSAFHSSFLLEGPFKKNKSSYLVAFRKTNRFPFTEIKNTPPQTNDFSIKLFFRIGQNHRISYTNINVIDRFNLTHIRIGKDSFPFPITNNNRINGQSLQWQATFFGQLYNKFSVHSSNQRIKYKYDDTVYPTLIDLNNKHISIRNDLSVIIDDKNRFETGFEVNVDHLKGQTKGIYEATDIAVRDSNKLYMSYNIRADKLYLAGYSHYEHQFDDKIRSSLGLRMDISNNKYVITFSPRWTLSYRYNSKLRFTGFAGLFRQDPDLIYGDSLRNLLPGQVWQLNLGAQYRKNRSTNFWTEAYFKHYQHLVVLNPDFSFDNSGKGEVVGIEFFGQITRGKTLMRFSYSLSKAWRKRFLQPRQYAFHFDQRHRFNLYGFYTRPTQKYRILPTKLIFNYKLSSGTPYTSILGYEMVGSSLLPVYSEINEYRNPWYHNMSVKFIWNFLPAKKLRIDMFFEIWNMFDTKNISERKFKPHPLQPFQALEILKYHSGILPNIGVKFYWK